MTTNRQRCAEADFEAAMIACAMAVDSEGRKIHLANIPYRGWQPDAELVTSEDLSKAFFSLTANARVSWKVGGERRWVINARLLLNALEAAVNYEESKRDSP